VASCTFEEQTRVLDITLDEVGSTTPIVCGVYTEGSLEAQRIAKMATTHGASALLVFPPAIYSFGQRPEMAVEHFKRIADASDLPLILFQYPLAGGQGYPTSTLLRILDEVPSIRAIKDWSANPQLHERQIRLLQSRTPIVNVLTTHSSWLMSSIVLGCNGLLSGSGSVIAPLQASLFEALQAKDLIKAQAVNERIYQMTEVFYTEPWVDMHNRMKEALVLLGKLPRAVVRPPLMKISSSEIERIKQALVKAELLKA
jgi:4-hydroxy-tetrahydrodipicolinate synthase